MSESVYRSRAADAPAQARAAQRKPLARHLALEARAERAPAPVQRARAPAPNRTGLPDGLKQGIESLSGLAMDDVRVHYGSARPAQLQAHAFTQGSDIHVAPGQERHLAHEAWHVVQQKQGRVRPTLQMKSTAINDDPALEAEADRMGARALSAAAAPRAAEPAVGSATRASSPVQRARTLGTTKKRATKRKGKAQRGVGRAGIKKPSRFMLGQHGAKKREQQRLSRAFGIRVSGSTHESEHTIGFEPLNRSSGLKRGKGKRARWLENKAFAYQEVKGLHRAHIGTGTRGTEDASGFNSESYREAQRSLVESGDVSSAVQINQLGYAFDPNFRTQVATDEGEAATDSYNEMVGAMDEVTYAEGDEDENVAIDARQRVEMYLARQVAITGRYPTKEEENAARLRFGVPVIS
jgi:hypothetical protein